MSSDADKMGRAFVLIRLNRRGMLYPDEKVELESLFQEFETWTRERRLDAADHHDKNTRLLNGKYSDDLNMRAADLRNEIENAGLDCNIYN